MSPFLESISQRKPLSPMYIWVHIIANENNFYRKRNYSKMVAKLSTTIEKIKNFWMIPPNPNEN